MVTQQLATIVLTLSWVGAAFAQAPPVLGGEGLSLEQLAGSRALVTVVIKGSGAEDPNLRIVDVGPNYIDVATENDRRYSYLFSSIKEIQVQKGQQPARMWRPPQGLSLAPAQQEAVAEALERVAELFETSNANQGVKLDAAALLAIAGDAGQQEAALEYIRAVHRSNDLASALFAAFRLYIAGRADAINPQVLEDALASGNRQIRGYAAMLAGLLPYHPAESRLLDMVRDRRPEVVGPAVISLARLGNRDIIPTLLAMLSELNVEKGEAAVSALERLRDDQTAEQLRMMLKTAEGMTRYRVARVLHTLGDPQTQHLLREEIMEVPTLRIHAALQLAKEGNVDAMRVIRDRLSHPYDENESSFALRARMAGALVHGGDRTAVPILQDLLAKNFPSVQELVCRQVVELGMRPLLAVVQPAIVSNDPNVAIRACQAALSIAYPELRERLIELWA